MYLKSYSSGVITKIYCQNVSVPGNSLRNIVVDEMNKKEG